MKVLLLSFHRGKSLVFHFDLFSLILHCNFRLFIIQAFISYTVMECVLYFPGPIPVLVGEPISVSHQSSR